MENKSISEASTEVFIIVYWYWTVYFYSQDSLPSRLEFYPLYLHVWQHRNRWARRKQYLYFDLFKAFD